MANHSTRARRRHGHLPGHIRQAFLLAAEAFTETAPGKHPPRVPFQVRYRDRTISVAEACGLVWNCTDIMPGSEFAALRDCLAEPPSSQTYAAAAHALLRELRDQREVNGGTDARLKRLYDRRDTMIEETAKFIAAENGLDLTDPLQRGRAERAVDEALERWEESESEDQPPAPTTPIETRLQKIYRHCELIKAIEDTAEFGGDEEEDSGETLLSAGAKVSPPMSPQVSERSSGTTAITPAPEPPARGISHLASGIAASGAPAGAGISDTQPAVPVQSYLVTTPLDGIDADLVSLTLRFDPALHNIVSDVMPELLTAGLEGWTREIVGSGNALLDRLADGDAFLQTAIVAALDDRAAVLQFSDPIPFRAVDLKRIKDGIVAFSRLKPRTAVVGVITLSACLIAVQVSWGVGRGLSTTVEYAVVEVGKALVDGITVRIREQTAAPNIR